MANQVSMNIVLGKLQNRINAYTTAIEFHSDSESDVIQAKVDDYRAILSELEILLEDFQDLDYKMYFGHQEKKNESFCFNKI